VKFTPRRVKNYNSSTLRKRRKKCLRLALLRGRQFFFASGGKEFR